MTKPAKVFGLDESRVWKAKKMYGDTYMMADLGKNETPEPPDTVAIKLPREVAREIGRYKLEGETLKAAAERLILEAISIRQAAADLDKSAGRMVDNTNLFPVIKKINLPKEQPKDFYQPQLWEDNDNYRQIVFEAVQDYMEWTAVDR